MKAELVAWREKVASCGRWSNKQQIVEEWRADKHGYFAVIKGNKRAGGGVGKSRKREKRLGFSPPPKQWSWQRVREGFELGRSDSKRHFLRLTPNDQPAKVGKKRTFIFCSAILVFLCAKHVWCSVKMTRRLTSSFFVLFCFFFVWESLFSY